MMNAKELELNLSDSLQREDILKEKLAESKREFRAADATIENLQMQLNAEREAKLVLAAENAGMKAFGDKLYSMYKALETSGGGFHDEQSIPYQQAALDAAMSALEEIKTPATDAFLAEARAQGVEMAAQSEQFSTWVQQGLRSFAIGVRQGDECAAQPAPAKSEPVAWLWSHRKHPSEVSLVRPEDDERAEGAHWSGWSCQALYAAPPAPVSVPAAYEHTEDFSEYLEGWNACRAAMLQGAEPVTTAYKLSPHIYRELVNRLRDTAVKYQGCQQLREQLSRTLQEVIQPAAPQQEAKNV